MRTFVRFGIVLAVAAIGGCDGGNEKKPAGGPGGAMPEHPATPESKPQLFDGIGSHHRIVTTTTKSGDVQTSPTRMEQDDHSLPAEGIRTRIIVPIEKRRRRLRRSAVSDGRSSSSSTTAGRS